MKILFLIAAEKIIIESESNQQSIVSIMEEVIVVIPEGENILPDVIKYAGLPVCVTSLLMAEEGEDLTKEEILTFRVISPRGEVVSSPVPSSFAGAPRTRLNVTLGSFPYFGEGLYSFELVLPDGKSASWPVTVKYARPK